MDLSKTYKTDKNIEKNGVWFDLGDGMEVLMARAGGSNIEYAMRLKALTKPYQRQMDMGTLSQEKQAHIFATVMSETIIKGWKGVSDEGVQVDYSEKAAYDLMIKYPELMNDLLELAQSREAY